MGNEMYEERIVSIIDVKRLLYLQHKRIDS
jgi:hypothetical protein